MNLNKCGLKALNLTKLHEKFNVPEFRLLDYDLISNIPGGKKRKLWLDKIRKLCGNRFFRKGIKFIARSSMNVEGGFKKGFHGVFHSQKFNSLSQLPSAIEKVKLSLEKSLEAKKNIDLRFNSIILQEHIKGKKGIAFLNPGENEFYAQCEYDPKHIYHILLRNGNSYFSDFEFFKEDGPILALFSLRGKELCDSIGVKKAIVEFVISQGEIFIVQAEKAEKTDFSSLLVRFENEMNYDFHYLDFDEKFFNNILKDIGLKSRLNTFLKEDGLFLKMGDLLCIESELYKNVSSKTFIENFRKRYLSFLKEEAIKVGKTNEGDALLALKTFNFRQAAFNFIYTRLISSFSKKGDFDKPYFKALYSLKNSLKSYISPIDNLYKKKIVSFWPHTDYENINEICRISLKDGLSALKKGIVPRLKKERKLYLIKCHFPLKGICLARGSAKGKARILTSKKDVEKIEKGDIVISPYLDSYCARAIARASGCITSVGGFFSHAALNSRELGKPCVGGISGCERIFLSGEMIEIKDSVINKV